MKDLAGCRFGRWTVIHFSHRQGKRYYWSCRCRCGSVRTIRSDGLSTGKSASCGCLAVDKGRSANTIHGLTKSAEWVIWTGIIQRCCNPRSTEYHNYGGRGITICLAWYKSFDRFLKDAGPRPSPKHSIDRYPNCNGNYEPGNVRWATSKEQTRNMRRNRMLTWNGRTQCMGDWAREIGVNITTLMKRLKRWDFERAMSQPRNERCVTTARK